MTNEERSALFTVATVERFCSRIELGPVSDRRPDLGHCWLWTGAKGVQGTRPYINTGCKVELAYRYSYSIFRGPLTGGLTIDHLCMVSLCVKPSHLEEVTNEVNVLRSAQTYRKTHCPKGHPYDLFNTYTPPGTTHRQCRTCIEINWKGRLKGLQSRKCSFCGAAMEGIATKRFCSNACRSRAWKAREATA